MCLHAHRPGATSTTSRECMTTSKISNPNKRIPTPVVGKRRQNASVSEVLQNPQTDRRNVDEANRFERTCVDSGALRSRGKGVACMQPEGRNMNPTGTNQTTNSKKRAMSWRGCVTMAWSDVFLPFSAACRASA